MEKRFEQRSATAIYVSRKPSKRSKAPGSNLFSIVFGQIAIVDRESLGAPLVFTPLEDLPAFLARVDRRDLLFLVEAIFEGIVLVDGIACVSVEHEKPFGGKRLLDLHEGASDAFEVRKAIDAIEGDQDTVEPASDIEGLHVASLKLDRCGEVLSSEGKGLFGRVHAVELRDLPGEHGEDAPRTATELQHAIGAHANGAVKVFVALRARVQGRVQIGGIVRAHQSGFIEQQPAVPREP